MATREEWIEVAGGTGKAIEYEHGVLNVGRDFLPPVALAVLDGADGSSEYWDWLIGEWRKESAS